MLYLAGIKVFGYQSQVTAAAIPRASTQIHVDSAGDPYVLNDK
jgi:hypothetical protein